MQILKVHLRNFRNFEDEHFTLDPKFTVIIGDNGSGKSNLLRALKLCIVQDYFELFRSSNLKIKFEEIDVRITPINSPKFSLQDVICKRVEYRFEGHINAIADKKLKSIFKNFDLESVKHLLPLFLSFDTNRLYGGTRQTETNTKGDFVKEKAYKAWYSLKHDSFLFSLWLVKSSKGPNSKLPYFLQAITNGVPNVSEVQYDPISKELLITYKVGEKLITEMPLKQCSDGMRVMVSLVAEIACRCIILNDRGKNNAVQETFGMIFIDEIDMHLHPNWQRTIVNDLQKAFPNIQFVASTHSPFIVQSLNANQIINLSESLEDPSDASSGLTDPTLDPSTSGVEAVSEVLMNVKQPHRSEDFMEMERKASEYFKLIREGSKNKSELAKAEKKLVELEAKYSHNPAYVALLKSELIK